MGLLKIGDQMPGFSYNTPFQQNLYFSDSVKKSEKTIVVFLRYFGCTLCQYDMHLYAQNYDKITANYGQLIVVLQSDPEKIAAQCGPDYLCSSANPISKV